MQRKLNIPFTVSFTPLHSVIPTQRRDMSDKAFPLERLFACEWTHWSAKSSVFFSLGNTIMTILHPKIVTKTAKAVIITPSEMIAFWNSFDDWIITRYVMMNATQITRTAKVQNETYFASLKLAGYLKLITPNIVDDMIIADSYTMETMTNSNG